MTWEEEDEGLGFDSVGGLFSLHEALGLMPSAP